MKNRAIFLIQLFLWLSLFLTIGTPMAHAAAAQNQAVSSQQVQAVQSMEDTLFAVHYDKEPLNERVSRIEETVFGQPQTGSSLEARITKLQGSLSPKALGPLSPLNKNATAQNGASPANGNAPPTSKASMPGNTPANIQNYAASRQVASNSGTSGSGFGNPAKQAPNNISSKAGNTATVTSPEPGETDYPTVSQMELKLFGKTFAKEDITQRLTRLENQVFKMTQTGSLADRTDNLRLVVLGDVGGQQSQAISTGYGQPGNGYGGYPSSYGQPAPQNSSYGYPQPPNYGGYGNAGGGSSPAYGSSYGSPPQSAYGTPGGYNPSANYGGLPNNIASAGAGGGNINPIPGYGAGGTSNVSYQPRDNNSEVTPDMMAAMSEVEKEVLGSTYPSEPLNARLDRVENKVFKTTSPEMNPQDRIQRVIAVASAGGAPMTGKQKAKATFQVLLPIILTILPLVLL